MGNEKKDIVRYVVAWHEVKDNGDIDMGVFGNYETRKAANEGLSSSVNETLCAADSNGDEVTVDFSMKPIVVVKYCGSVTSYKVEAIDA